MLRTKQKAMSEYHFESNESIEASLAIWPDPSDNDEAPHPSACPAELMPLCAGFHNES